MRILVLGAGAVGGYFGGRMAKAGADVTFLVRPGRARQLADGLVIESPLGDARVDIATLGEGEEAAPFDVVLLTCKAYGLAGALASIAPHVRPGTVIAPLLNGLAHLAAIEARFPEAVVWGGVAKIPATLAADGTVRHLGRFQSLIFGARAGQEATRPLAEELVATASNAGIESKLSDDIEQELWEKWVFLATLAAATCLTRSPVGRIVQSERGSDYLAELLAECTAIAGAEGHAPGADAMAGYRQQLSDPNSAMVASMLRDLEQGFAIEGEHVIGDLLARGRRHSLASPHLETAWMVLECYIRAREAPAG